MSKQQTVSAYVKGLLARQATEHGIVVWYDPQQHYSRLAAALQLPKCRVLCYERGFFALRYALEPFSAQCMGTSVRWALQRTSLRWAPVHIAVN